jgi:hypothetical protein
MSVAVVSADVSPLPLNGNGQVDGERNGSDRDRTGGPSVWQNINRQWRGSDDRVGDGGDGNGTGNGVVSPYNIVFSFMHINSHVLNHLSYLL